MELLSPARLDGDPALTPDVAFVIRTLNEQALIGRCLEALAEQEFAGTGEVIVVDSGSRDATLSIVGQHPVRLLEIAREDFTYSHALNLGVAATRAPLVVSLSAHVIPLDGSWLRRLSAPLADPAVAGCHGRELPWPHADPFERFRLASVFGDRRVVRRRTEWRGPPRERPHDFIFSNACSCFRRSLWAERPFRELPYAEDLDWARWAIQAGYQIVYEPEARAYHSHDETLRARARRELSYERARAMIFDRPLAPARLSAAYLLGAATFVGSSLRREPLLTVPRWAMYSFCKWLYLSWLLASHREPRDDNESRAQ
jgi:rhamnosyltransferase